MSEAFQATHERRQYSRWVANETIEDFALRFTAHRARHRSMGRVANTALGAISFLALEAIGAAITLSWGFETALLAIVLGGLILFITGLPIAWYAARYGVDIDLLTRGAGFGYLGSTLTSLIYASFTFIFFALEAAILATALQLLVGIPVSIGYLISALAVLPLVTHGFAKISAFQALTQPVWVLLQVFPFVLLALSGYGLQGWIRFEGLAPTTANGGHVPQIVAFGAASGVVLALIAQIGEQVDILRFLPEPRSARENRRWWIAVIAAGPGWVFLGALKMLLGSWLITLVPVNAIQLDIAQTIDPTALYHRAFALAVPSTGVALALTGIFVILSQLKINVTNAYAGSIAWSNFFSRITHAHPGRVVWLVFNVAIALLLMELGVFGALEATLSIYSQIALAWIGAIFADLTINKPLGLSPKGIEFRRGHLYDVNPVGIGAMAGGASAAFLAHSGIFGTAVEAMSPFVALIASILLAPLIAVATNGRYYIARPAPQFAAGQVECCLCQYRFDPEDMTGCPFYSAPICSLCCSLNASCADACKPHATLSHMVQEQIETRMPAGVARVLRMRLSRFIMTTALLVGVCAAALLLIRHTAAESDPASLDTLLALIFASSAITIGIAVWLFLLTREARLAARRDTELQTERLLREVRAHERTDLALQDAKEKAEAASLAKTRYMAGLSHELRTPLNAIYGYAQLLDADPSIPSGGAEAVRAIRRSSEHLAGLIEELLDISKIEAGRLELTRTRVHLPDLLRQITDIFQETARRSGLDFQIERLTKLPDWVMVDEKRLRQIVINLLANAMNYTSRGRVTLRINWRNQVATIEVEDTGIGIAPNELERIWSPFERGSGHTSQGMGLGLTITRLLVDVLGGDISVSSTPGQGSVFQLKLYLAEVPALTIDPNHQEVEPAGESYDGRRRLIMIVDDDNDHLQLMETYLRPHGFNTMRAPSAEAARDQLAEIAPDLVLLDIDLPSESGWDFLRWLRVNGHSAMPVIILSGHALEAQSDAPDIRLHDAFIAKPFILDDLLARIDGLLKLNRHQPAVDDDVCASSANTLAAETLAQLRDLAGIGHMRAIREVMATAPMPQSLRAELQALLMQADFERFTHVLDTLSNAKQD